jgi:hypothetical protein
LLDRSIARNPGEERIPDGSGGHLFAATGEEHARNHAAWREIRARKVAAEKAGAAPP